MGRSGRGEEGEAGGAPLTAAARRPWAGGTEGREPGDAAAERRREALAKRGLPLGSRQQPPSLYKAARPSGPPTALGGKHPAPPPNPSSGEPPSLSPGRPGPVGIAVIRRLLNRGSASLKRQRLSQFLRGGEEKITAFRSTPKPCRVPVQQPVSPSPPPKRAVSWRPLLQVLGVFCKCSPLFFRRWARNMRGRGKAFPFHKKVRSQRDARLSTATV